MGKIHFSLKGEYSHSRREVKVENFEFDIEGSDEETSQITGTVKDIANSINETSKYNSKKTRELEEIHRINADIKESARALDKRFSDTVADIKSFIGDFKYEANETRKRVAAMTKTIIQAADIPDETKDKLAKNLCEMNDVFNKYQNKITNCFRPFDNK